MVINRESLGGRSYGPSSTQLSVISWALVIAFQEQTVGDACESALIGLTYAFIRGTAHMSGLGWQFYM